MPNEVKCADCKVPLELSTDPNGEKRLTCPSCGVGGGYDEVMSEIGEQIRGRAGDALSAALANAARGSKSVTYKRGTRSNKRQRFIRDQD